MAAELVTTGFQVEVETDGKRKPMGRVYQVREAAEALCDLFREGGQTAHVEAIQKFERDNKRIR